VIKNNLKQFLDSPNINKTTINNIVSNKDQSSKNLIEINQNNEITNNIQKENESSVLNQNDQNIIFKNSNLNSNINDTQNKSKVVSIINSDIHTPEKLNSNKSLISIPQEQNLPHVNPSTKKISCSISLNNSYSNIRSNNGSPTVNKTVTINNNIDELSNFNLIKIIFNDINNQINESLKGSQESISWSLKDLFNQKYKFKLLNQKADKQMKEIEYAIIQRRKLGTDEKNNYNLSLKEKAEDKILNLLNEFDEIKGQLLINFEDAKKSETNFNEILKANFLFNLIIAIQGIKKLKISFNEMIDNKINYLKTIERVILQAIEGINKMEYLIHNLIDYKCFFETKNIPFSKIK